MREYTDVIQQFFYEALPAADAAPAVKFEAVSAAVFGTKQRRYGPLPPPEAAVLVRDALRAADAAGEPYRFFTPWASLKQDPARRLDLLEVCALRQLACLRADLGRFGKAAEFYFRVDNLTDRYLFGDEHAGAVADYGTKFRALAEAFLPGAVVQFESQFASYREWAAEADAAAPVFYKYLRGEAGADKLAALGWVGEIPQAQRDYYLAAYRTLYPGQDPLWVMARYFANTLTRKTAGALATPRGPHVAVNFHRPVPGNPLVKPVAYYRTLRAEYTHAHTAPWIGRGYFRLGDDNTCTPRFVDPDTRDLVPNTVVVAGVEVDAPYATE